MSTDSDIIRRARDDARVFAELYDRHARPITGFAIRRVGEHAADDIVNETFLTAFRRVKAFDLNQEGALPWLLGIASNMVRRHRAQEARHWRVLAQLPAWHEVSSEDTEGSDRALDAHRELARLAPAIGSLSMRDREVLLLYASGELTYRNRSVLLQELSRRPAPCGRLAVRVGLVATAGVAAVGTMTVLALTPMQTTAPASIAATTAPPVSTQPPAPAPAPTPTSTSEPTTEPVPVPPTVASVLAQAANVVASSTMPATGFRRIEITETRLTQVGHAEDGTSLGDLADPEDVDVATLDTLKWNVFLPMDRDGGWVREVAGNATREALWG